MAGVLICPPPGKTTAALFITDTTHHDNPDKTIMVKESGEELASICCCLTRGCCDFGGIEANIPDPVFVTLSGCGCFGGSYTMPKTGSGSGNTGLWQLSIAKCGTTLNLTLVCNGSNPCDPGTPIYYLTITNGLNSVVLDVVFWLVSCEPFHLTVKQACIRDPLTECGGDWPCDCSSLDGQVTE